MPDDTQLSALISSRPRASAQLEATLLEFQQLEDEVATLEELVKEKKARAKYLGENVIVELVEEEHLNNGCVLADGREYVFERKVSASVSKDNKPAAFRFLEERNADAMLKRYLTLSFGKDSKVQAARVKTMISRVLPQYEVGVRVGLAPEGIVTALREILKAADLNIEIEETLELPGPTLISFVKKELKAGRNLPECFGVYAPLRAIFVEPAPVAAEPETLNPADM